jgi:hypothetical protein
MNKNALFGLGGFVVGVGLTLAISGGNSSNMAGQAIGSSARNLSVLINQTDFNQMTNKEADSTADCMLDCEDTRDECEADAIEEGSLCHQGCDQNNNGSTQCHLECDALVVVNVLGCTTVFWGCNTACFLF